MSAPGNRAVLAERAAALRDEGLTRREIQDALGLSRSYTYSLLTDPDGSIDAARKMQYRGVCEDCGGPTSYSNKRPGYGFSTRCMDCELKRVERERMWPREAVIEAIQRFAAINGRPPTATEWQRADRVNNYPSGSQVYNNGTKTAAFDKWADAIEAAGFPRPHTGRRRRDEQTGEDPMAVRLERPYLVFRVEDDALHLIGETEAATNDEAISNVAEDEGMYASVAKASLQERRVRRRLAVERTNGRNLN